MPSILHEVLIDLFRHDPELAPRLLAELGGLTVPSYETARTSDPDAVEMVPVGRRADLVVLLEVAAQPVLALVLEVQLAVDDKKRRSWPNYVTTLAARHECDVVLLVVAPDDSVARWAAQPIRTGHPGFDLHPIVLGRDAIPRIEDPAQASRRPELAVLSAIAHGNEPEGLSVVVAAIEAAKGVEPDRAMAYREIILKALTETARRRFKEMLDLKKIPIESEIFKPHYDRGLAEGEARGRAEALLALMRVRGLAPSDAQQARISSCRDIPTLDRWIAHAATAGAVESIFDGAEPAGPEGTPTP